MKFSKFGLMFASAAIAAGVFADAANVLVSFSTTSDKYADGTPVKDGEWYALCWSADGKFDGLNLDCTPVDPAEKVLILAPLAKGGRCPYVLFQIDSAKAPVGGNYFVYLLDTRDVAGNPSPDGNPDDGRLAPKGMSGSAAVQSYTASANIGSNVATATDAVSGATAEWNAVQPKITDFKLVGDATVKITVEGMMRGLNYTVKMGSNLGNLEATTIKPETEDGKAVFYVDDKDARFFKVIAE